MRQLHLLSVFLLCCGMLYAQDPEYVLTIRMLPNAKAKTLQAVLAATKPVQASVTVGKTTKELLRAYYGHASVELQRAVRAANPGINLDATFLSNREVSLPAFPRWSFDAPRIIDPAKPVLAQVQASVGVIGPKTIGQIYAKNPELPSPSPGATYTQAASALSNALKAKQQPVALTLPFDTSYASYDLQITSAAAIEQLLAILRQDDAVRLASVSTKPRLIAGLTSEQLTNACADTAAIPGWPYQSFTFDHIPGSQHVTVAILDSGIPEDDQRFPLWTNLLEQAGVPGKDSDGNHCLHDVNGCNMLTRDSFPNDDITEGDLAGHGTHVAGLVSGRLLSVPLRHELDERLRLMIVKIADEKGDVYPAELANGIYYSRLGKAGLINLSLETSYSEVLEKAIAENPATLFIVAAGNGLLGIGFNIDAAPRVYPAALARTYPNVISVAAHDRNGQLACFSNYGENSVDLAAPGVDVESTTFDGTRKLSGTSQAAPIVTLTAALLLAQGIDTPALVKARILAGTDFDPSLIGKLRSAGRLNMTTTLSIREDVLRLHDGTLVRGHLLDPKTIELPDGAVPIHTVQKVILHYQTGPNGQRVFVLEQGHLKQYAVHLDIPQLRMRVGNETRTYSFADVSEIVPALNISPLHPNK